MTRLNVFVFVISPMPLGGTRHSYSHPNVWLAVYIYTHVIEYKEVYTVISYLR